MTPAGAFLAALRRFPDRTLLHHRTRRGEARITFDDAARALAATIRQLRELGLGREQRVLCYDDDNVRASRFMLAAACLGLTLAPISCTFSTRAAVAHARRCQARVAFTSHEHRGALGEAGLDCWTPPEDAGAAPALTSREAGEILERACDDARGDRPYAIFSTTGSTGEPRLVVRSTRSILEPAGWLCEALALTADRPERLLFCSGLSHSLGHYTLWLAVLVGAALCIPEGLEAAASLDDVRALDPTFVQASPRVIKSLYEQHVAAGGDPEARFFGPGMRFVRTGGSAMAPRLFERLHAHGIDVGENYGSSETSVIAFTRAGGWRPGHVGTICPGVDVRSDVDGEILVRSELATRRYLGGGSEQAFRSDDFIRTGDLGELTADGYLKLLGRKHEVLNAPNGSNIHAAGIEARVESLPWVHQAVLFGHQRPYVVALITLHARVESRDADGFLDERAFPELYRQARSEIARLNAELEPFEQIRALALFGKPLAAPLYQAQPPLGKIKRDRRAIAEAFAPRIEALYAAG